MTLMQFIRALQRTIASGDRFPNPRRGETVILDVSEERVVYRGNRAPSLQKTAEALAAQLGERIANSGAVAANVLGLTTQVPVTPVFLTSGPSRTLKLGRQEVRLRHSPPWQLVLRGRRAGEAVRALAWLGPEMTGPAIEKLRRSLNAEERRELAGVSAQMPGWLAEPVSRLAHG